MTRTGPALAALLAVVLATCVAGCAKGSAESGEFVDPMEAAGSVDFVMTAPFLQPTTGVPGSIGGAAQAPARERSEVVPADADAEAPAAAKAPPALAAPAADVAAAADRPATQAGEARQVVYTAAFKVVVADVAGTLAAVRANAEQLGGYLSEVNGASITVRVPVARFTDAVAFVERAGEVVDRQLRAQDVTEELRDLNIHLDNDEKLRQRFQALLDKAEKVEDVLKIEAELTRVSGEIERTKGRLRYLEAQVAMSTIRVELNSPLPQQGPGRGGASPLPFHWVAELGAGLIEGQLQQTVRKAGFFGRGPEFRPPAGFVRYYEHTGIVEAMDAGDVRLRVVRRANVDKADLPFWSQLARKSLVEGRSLAVTSEEGGAAGDEFYLLRGTREVGGKPVGYLLSIERSNRAVVIFEAWGPAEALDANVDALRESALSIDAG